MPIVRRVVSVLLLALLPGCMFMMLIPHVTEDAKVFPASERARLRNDEMGFQRPKIVSIDGRGVGPHVVFELSPGRHNIGVDVRVKGPWSSGPAEYWVVPFEAVPGRTYRPRYHAAEQMVRIHEVLDEPEQ